MTAYRFSVKTPTAVQKAAWCKRQQHSQASGSRSSSRPQDEQCTRRGRRNFRPASPSHWRVPQKGQDPSADRTTSRWVSRVPAKTRPSRSDPGTRTKWTMGMGSATAAAATPRPKATAARARRRLRPRCSITIVEEVGGTPKPRNRACTASVVMLVIYGATRRLLPLRPDRRPRCGPPHRPRAAGILRPHRTRAGNRGRPALRAASARQRPGDIDQPAGRPDVHSPKLGVGGRAAAGRAGAGGPAARGGWWSVPRCRHRCV
jgi:hypothetical protein